MSQGAVDWQALMDAELRRQQAMSLRSMFGIGKVKAADLSGFTSIATTNAVAPVPETKVAKLPRRRQADTFVCWRWWRVKVEPETRDIWLRSTYRDHLWEGPIMHAHKDPTTDNTSGIYGYFWHAAPHLGFDRVETEASKERSQRAILAGGFAGWSPFHQEYEELWYPIGGEIELFGKCVVHDTGVRAEHARIRRLQVYVKHMPYMRPEVLDWLASRYGCDVEIGQAYEDTKGEEAK